MTAPPADAILTPWPAVLPCANPRAFSWQGRIQGTLFWSSSTGDRQVAFDADPVTDTSTLPASLPAGVLERLWVSKGPAPEAIGLDCTVPDSYDGAHSIEWSYLSPGARATVSVGYRIPRLARAWRLARWITPWYTEPAGQPHSAFLSKIGGRGKDSGASSVQLTRDILSDLRDVIAAACGARRCSTTLQSLSSTTLAVTRVSNPTHERLDRDSTEVEPFGHKFEWRVTTDPATVDVACSTVTVHQVACELTILTSTGTNLHYDAFQPDIELFNPYGHIELLEVEHGASRITISGAALAIREPVGTGKRE